MGFKRSNKGHIWNRQAGAMLEARDQIAGEGDADEAVPSSKKRRAAIERSKDLARALLNALVSGELVHAFSNVGVRVDMAFGACE